MKSILTTTLCLLWASVCMSQINCEVFKTNVDGVYAGTHDAVPLMKEGGSIIVISSINSHTVFGPGVAMYSASKAAVSALVRGWARDLGRSNIRANTVPYRSDQ